MLGGMRVIAMRKRQSIMQITPLAIGSAKIPDTSLRFKGYDRETLRLDGAV